MQHFYKCFARIEVSAKLHYHKYAAPSIVVQLPARNKECTILASISGSVLNFSVLYNIQTMDIRQLSIEICLQCMVLYGCMRRYSTRISSKAYAASTYSYA